MSDPAVPVDRLDEIAARAKACGLMSDESPAGVALMDVAWLVRDLREARAEIERRRYAQSLDLDAVKALQAELAAERAKVERVEKRLDEVEQYGAGLTDVVTIRIDAVRAALAGDDR